jgi:hypothetical protein
VRDDIRSRLNRLKCSLEETKSYGLVLEEEDLAHLLARGERSVVGGRYTRRASFELS